MSQLERQKVIMIYGTRRVGKTTLIKNIATRNGQKTLVLQGEDLNTQSLFKKRTIANYTRIIGSNSLLIIDEAQAIPNVGAALKLMIDNIDGLTILVTGSSSFNLSSSAGEPLVGRQLIHELFPIAQAELNLAFSYLEMVADLEDRMIYGNYPELWHIQSEQEREEYLKTLVNSYLLKDILAFENVKGSEVLYNLLKLLAFQIGNEVSNVELANSLKISKDTVAKYLDLLSKVFIIYPLSGFSRNLRKEISKSKKWYFYDNGIRNAIINNFSRFENREDVGPLWEQFFLSERRKFNAYRSHSPEYYFWRTYDSQEIDLIEVDSEQRITAFECKWSKSYAKTPIAFANAYPQATFHVVNKDNYFEYVMD